MRSIEWDAKHNQLRMIDQRILPARLEILAFKTASQVAEAIRSMIVRGAPAIGAAAAYGLVLAAIESAHSDISGLKSELKLAHEQLQAARPTAVNLIWSLRRMMEVVEQPYQSPSELVDALLQMADQIADEDIETNRLIGEIGAAVIDDGDTIIHHCNTGALATVDWGTALGVIRCAHEQGKRIHVLVDETRPRLQGARLTAWELSQYGIPYHIIADNAAGYFLHSGKVQKVLFGADRVAANGDVANKIGTYMLALAAHANHIPVYAVLPTSTIDMSIKTGEEIPIEERDSQEVLGIQYLGESVVPEGAQAYNPAFDVTPHQLITAIITEKGLVYPPFSANLARLMGASSTEGHP